MQGSAKIGQEMVFTVCRQRETLEISVYVGEQIQSALEQQEQEYYPGNFPWARP